MKSKRYNIDLPAHMAECDANYLRVNKLFPGLVDLAEKQTASLWVDVAGHRFEVRLQVLECSPYTTGRNSRPRLARGRCGCTTMPAALRWWSIRASGTS